MSTAVPVETHESARRARIVLISNYPADHATFTGGVQTATAALLEGLLEHRDEFDFHVVSLSRSLPHDRVDTRDGVQFHFLSVKYAWLPTRFPLRMLKVFRELRRIQPDLVHSHGNQAAALTTVLARYCRVLTVHGIGRHELRLRSHVPSWQRYVSDFLERVTHERFGPIICISEYARRVVGPSARTFLIPNAVGSSFFELGHRVTHEPPRLLMAGTLSRLKRPADLVAAHATLRRALPTLETLLVGPFEDELLESSLRQTVADGRIEGVRFLGPVARPELAELLTQTTALVLPSAQENAPMVIAEAMAAGLPVVATRVGGVTEMVQPGETGFLYEAGDIPGLTRQLERLLRDPELGRRMGERARVRAKALYGPSRVAAETVAVYRQLMGAPPRPAACEDSSELVAIDSVAGRRAQ